MGERVSVRDGILPVVVVAPHGFDDPYTDIIAETIANRLDCYAVINCGWEREDKVDVNNDKANCNSIAHCHEDVVKDEFLDPLIRYIHRSNKTIYAAGGLGGTCPFLKKTVMLTIHGAGDQARVIAKNPKLDFILGTGLGKPPRPTCESWRKTAFAYYLVNKGVNVWEGKAGGGYAAWGKDNLNQLFVGKYPGLAESIQIEIIRKPWRENEKRAEGTGNVIADTIKEVLKIHDISQFKADLGVPQV